MLSVSAGIIVLDSKILCMQRSKSKYDYLSFKFEFPGGKVEPGESPKETLIRELKEEMDADVSSAEITLFNEIEYTYPDFSVHLYNFIVKVNEFNFIMKEHNSYKWVTPVELSELDWAAADELIINDLKRHLNE